MTGDIGIDSSIPRQSNIIVRCRLSDPGARINRALLLIMPEAAGVLPPSVRGGQILRNAAFACDAINSGLERMLHWLGDTFAIVAIITR
jgi:hypothetical protein